MNRRDFFRRNLETLISLALAPAVFQVPLLSSCSRRESHQLTARKLVEAVRSGKISLEELAELTLKAALKAQEKFHPFIDLDSEVVHQEFKRAGSLDKNAPAFGLPVAVKDNLAIQGYPLSAGFTTPTLPKVKDSWAVARLRQAGAIPFARTNLPEFAFGVLTQSSKGGITGNPHLPGLVSGGSSGGAAAAVAAQVCPIALGTDTAGSIRIPAAFCGLWGLRPSSEKIRQDGLLVLSALRDSIGPLARTADDLAFFCESFLELGSIAEMSMEEIRKIRFFLEENLMEAAAPEIKEDLLRFESFLKIKGFKVERKKISFYEDIRRWAREDSLLYTLPRLEEQVRSHFGVSLKDEKVLNQLSPIVSPLLKKHYSSPFRKISLAESTAKQLSLKEKILNEVLTDYSILILPSTMTPPAPQAEIGRISYPLLFDLYTRPNIFATCLQGPALAIPALSPISRGTGFQLNGRPGEDKMLLSLGLYLEKNYSNCRRSV